MFRSGKLKTTTAKGAPRNLWHDTNQLIASFIPKDKDVAHLAQTCRFLYHDTKHVLATNKKKALQTLAHHVVVEPSEEKVIDILSRQPELVMGDVIIDEIVDNSDRTLVNNTLFQLAYGADDDAMCLAMKPFFIKVYGSEKAGIQEMERQRNNKFAESKEENRLTKAQLTALINPVMQAITNEAFNSGSDNDNKLILSAATNVAIEHFRKEFANSQPKHIEKGMHFCNDTLVDIFDIYALARVRWNYDLNKCGLFEDAILSCVSFYAPANDAQRYSQGLYNLKDRGEKYTRSLALRCGGNNFYLVCHKPSTEFSLLGSYIDINHGGAPLLWRTGESNERILKLMSNKKVKLAELMSATEPHPKSQCIIC
jgi:hypothetical protein